MITQHKLLSLTFLLQYKIKKLSEYKTIYIMKISCNSRLTRFITNLSRVKIEKYITFLYRLISNQIYLDIFLLIKFLVSWIDSLTH